MRAPTPTYLSRVSASRYARIVRNPIRTTSPSRKNQLRNLEKEKTRCTTRMTVKRSADCHA